MFCTYDDQRFGNRAMQANMMALGIEQGSWQQGLDADKVAGLKGLAVHLLHNCPTSHVIIFKGNSYPVPSSLCTSQAGTSALGRECNNGQRFWYACASQDCTDNNVRNQCSL
jgi:hypothetical protein